MTGLNGGVIAAVVCIATACAPAARDAAPRMPGSAGMTESATQSSVRAARGGTVLLGSQLRDGSSVLDAVESRIANMRVDWESARCPRISLRGLRTLVGSSDPTVYVDGMRMANTCALVSIRTSEVGRVEVYPGVTNPPGYRPSPNGMLLVFLNGAESQ